jgi:hypothetical protein
MCCPRHKTAACRVGKGGPDVSIDLRRQIRRAYQQRRGGHGGTCTVPYIYASAAFPPYGAARFVSMLKFERD